MRVESADVESVQLLVHVPFWQRIYVAPWLFAYPAAAYMFYGDYDRFVGSIEWTFLLCIVLFGGHALSFLGTRWSVDFRAWGEARKVNVLQRATAVKVTPKAHRGKGEIVPLSKTPAQVSFSYQRDKYILYGDVFKRLQFPYDNATVGELLQVRDGVAVDATKLEQDYGKNVLDIPVPTFGELFAEHAVAPFFVFQVFCVALWFFDEYWYYSLFTLFMLIVFECTTVFQRQRTINEFRSMSIKPFTIRVLRNKKWQELQTDELVPGDVVEIARTKDEHAVPCDLVLLSGNCIVNEAMLSGESTPLLKEPIETMEASERITSEDRNSTLYGGTKVLQAAPDSRALVLRTGFGTSQGSLIRTMIFSTETVSANNLESFLFIAFLLVFAIIASAYVWVKGVEQDRKRSKLLLDCVIIITSVVPPELPMELTMAVNASLVALQKYAIFCTEPFRIPFAGRVDVCCFDKTGTITGEDLVVEGIATNSTTLSPLTSASQETTLTLAAAHALVLLEDAGVVGDPMEKTAIEALGWQLGKNDKLTPKSGSGLSVRVQRRFQFSSALKRMSTISYVTQAGRQRTFIAVKGAPETLKGMYTSVPDEYEHTYKWFAQRGSRVLALGYKWQELKQDAHRDDVESGLTFAGFLVFHCPLKPDAVETLQSLADSSHRCVMITGDNPLTASHVAREVEIVDRQVLILDSAADQGLAWHTVDDSLVIPVRGAELDTTLFDKYDICITGAAVRHFAEHAAEWRALVANTWVYARVSPAQKELILTTYKALGLVTLMAGDGTNDVGALKQANIGVALLNGSEDDLKAIAEHAKRERVKKVYESQLKITARFGQPPPPVPTLIADMYPDAVTAQRRAAEQSGTDRRRGGGGKFDVGAITEQLNNMEDENEVPTIRLGDASVAAPFTSKLANVSAITHIIRQGRASLVSTTQMFIILGLNCLITAWALSVQYLQGIRFGDYQMTISGISASVCFMCISRARTIEKLAKERPMTSVLNAYSVLSILGQTAVHVAAYLYITDICYAIEKPSDVVDLDAKFTPNLLNSAVFLLSLLQQVSTFVINFIGRPWREGITENKYLYYGLLGAAGVAICGATDFVPEFSRWLQLVEMAPSFRFKLTATMFLDFAASWTIERVLKKLLADTKPKPIILKGSSRREARRREQLRAKKSA